MIHGGLYEFLTEAKQRTNPGQNPKTLQQAFKPNASTYDNDNYEKLAPIIPKNFNFSVKAATFSAVKENSQNDFSAKLQLFTVWQIYLQISINNTYYSRIYYLDNGQIQLKDCG